MFFIIVCSKTPNSYSREKTSSWKWHIQILDLDNQIWLQSDVVRNFCELCKWPSQIRVFRQLSSLFLKVQPRIRKQLYFKNFHTLDKTDASTISFDSCFIDTGKIQTSKVDERKPLSFNFIPEDILRTLLDTYVGFLHTWPWD